MLPRTALLFLLVPMLVGSTLADGANPNHLEPIAAYDPDGYDQAVFNALIGKQRPVLWMVCKPRFRPEYAVILRTEPLNPTAQSPSLWDQTRKWTLEVATATQPIWHWKDYSLDYHGPLELDLRRNVKVDRKMLEIDRSFAQEIGKAWEGVIRKTRYAEKRWRGFDGVTYQFYYDYGYFGETWSPDTGVPAALVDLAEHLKNVVESGAGKRKALLAEALRKAKNLQADAAKSDRATRMFFK